MHPDIVKLLDLQARDVRLLEADQALDAVLADLEALDQQLANTAQQAEQARLAVTDASRRRGEIEAKIDNYKKLEARGTQRLDLVKTPKESQAVMTELDLARSVLAREEADWVKLSDLIASLELQAQEAEQRLQVARDGQEAARAAIEERRQAADAVRQAALAERDAAAAEVNRALRSRYERLRTVKSTRVVIALEGATCGACHTAVPLNRRSQMRAGTLIDACESCGVILYSAEILE